MPSPAVRRFRELHASGCFVLPNPWDRGSVRVLEACGFQALATTSSGFAFTRARPDEIGALHVDEVLAHVRDIASATSLPVNADFMHGYARTVDGLAANVERCARTGVAGLSIEDATGSPEAPLFPRDVALERVRAARAAIDATGTGVLLTARCEAWLVGQPDARSLAVERLVLFAEAGADCLYAPGVFEPEAIDEIVRAVAPRPVNVLMSRPVEGLTLARLADLGVRRVSVGSGLARVAWGAFLRSAREIATTGRFDALAEAAPFDELNRLFGGRG